MTTKRYTEANWRSDPQFRALCDAIAACKSEGEAAAFLRDIGSLSELQAWGERLEVAKQLSQGKTYRQVAANTGASTTTVTRVAKFLSGGEGGYMQYLSGSHQHTSAFLRGEKTGSVLKGYLERAHK
jgi:TrpR-related protein YerC/YecD